MPVTIVVGRQVVGGIEAPRQPLRQNQQRRAGHAAQEVRRLDQPERQDAIEQREPPGGGGRGAREEQHQPGEKREDGQHARRELLRQLTERGADARRVGAALSHFVGDEPDRARRASGSR